MKKVTNLASALTEILTTWLHKTCTGLLDFKKLEKDLQSKKYLFWLLKAIFLYNTPGGFGILFKCPKE